MKNERKFPDVAGFLERNRALVYGMMLGDATIPYANGKNTMLEFGHGPQQKEYLFHKFKIMEEVSYPPTFVSGDKGGSWRFHTVKHLEFQKLWSTFHEGSKKRSRNGKTYIPKVVNKKILDALDDHGVALWWMDDAWMSFCWNDETHQWREYAKISTCDFTAEENELMLAWFGERYGAKGKVEMVRSQKHKDTWYPLLHFNWQEALKIVQRIDMFVPDCMKSKTNVEAAKMFMSKSLLEPHGLKFDGNGIENIEERVHCGTMCGSYPA